MTRTNFGHVDGKDVHQVLLRSAEAEVAILSYGAIVRDWRVDGNNATVPVVLGFPSLEDYVLHSKSHGIVAGRVANRTAGACFELDGQSYRLSQNYGVHHLHGGKTGLGRRIWEMETDLASESVRLNYLSPDGEEGYPGDVAFSVTYRLDGPQLICEMRGLPSRPTPINLAQHNYYNLAGQGDVLDHVLQVNASQYTVTDRDLIPTGEIAEVAGTHLDFVQPRALGDSPPEACSIDDNLVLDTERDRNNAAASVVCEQSGLNLRLWTDEPGLQVFNAATQQIGARGHDGAHYGPYSGLCLEAQHFPDSLNHPEWPSIVRTPEYPYEQQLRVEISR